MSVKPKISNKPGLVSKYINTSYDIVKVVSDNIDYVIAVGECLLDPNCLDVGAGSGVGTAVWSLNGLDAYYVDGNIGIGLTSPIYLTHIYDGPSSATAYADGEELVIEDNSSAGISILTPDANTSGVYLGSPSANRGASLIWNYDSNSTIWGTRKAGASAAIKTGNDATALTLDSSQNAHFYGNIGVNTVPTYGSIHILVGTGSGQIPGSITDDIFVDSSTSAGMCILANDAGYASYTLGSTTERAGFGMTWRYSTGEGQIGTSKAGSSIILYTNNYDEALTITSTFQLHGQNGLDTSPTYSFANAPSSGMYRYGAGNGVGFAAGGVYEWYYLGGIEVGAATGGPQGIGTVNAEGYYLNGVDIESSITGWAISGASYSNDEGGVWLLKGGPVRFKSDGTVYAVCDSDVSGQVYTRNVSPGWDVSTKDAIIGGDTNTEETAQTGIDFSRDGTKMYVIGTGSKTVYRYSITAWSTASVPASDVNSGALSITTPAGFMISDDGLKFYVGDANNNTIYEYSCDTAYDVSDNPTQTGNTLVVTDFITACDFFIGNNGTELYVGTYNTGTFVAKVVQYTMSTAWNLSTATLTGSYTLPSGRPRGVCVGNGGTTLFVYDGLAFGQIYQYTMPPAFANGIHPDPHYLSDGSVTAPAYGFTSAYGVGAGMYYDSGDVVIAVGGIAHTRFDTNGNIGVNSTPHVDWDVNCNVIDLGDYLQVYGNDNNGAGVITNNAYYEQGLGAWSYISNNYATRVDQQLGSHKFYTAGSGTADVTINWTELLALNADGSVDFGSPNAGSAPDTIGIVNAKGYYIDGVAFGVSGSTPWFLEGGTGPDIYYDAGNVAIGKNTASVGLDLLGQSLQTHTYDQTVDTDTITNEHVVTITDTGGADTTYITRLANKTTMDINSSTGSLFSLYTGNYIIVQDAGATAAIGQLTGTFSRTSDTTGWVKNQYGGSFSSLASGGASTTKSNLQGIVSVAQTVDTDITTVMGVNATGVVRDNVTVTDLIIVNGTSWVYSTDALDTLSLTNLYSFKSSILDYETGTSGTASITNIYGFYAGSPTGTSTNVTNEYGIYIEAPNLGTNQWAMYVAGGKSYFGGEIEQISTFTYTGDASQDFNLQSLTIQGNATSDITTTFVEANVNNISFDIDYSSTKGYFTGEHWDIDTVGSTASMFYLTGLWHQLSDDAAYVDNIQGFNNSVTASPGYTGTRTSVQGIFNLTSVQDDATTTFGIGSTLRVNNGSATISTAKALIGELSIKAGSGNIANVTTATAIQATMLSTDDTLGTNNITDLTGVYIATGAGASQTVTNAYGLYVEEPTIGSTLNYASYIAGGKSYFGGEIEQNTSISIPGDTGIDTNYNTQTITLASSATSDASVTITNATQLDVICDIDHSSNLGLIGAKQISLNTTGSTQPLYWIIGEGIQLNDDGLVAANMTGVSINLQGTNGYTGTRGKMTGLNLSVSARDDLTNQEGISSAIGALGASFSVTNMTALRGAVSIAAGTTDTINVTNAIAVEADVLYSDDTSGTNNITNLYGFYFRDDTATGQTVTNEYGLYIENPSIGTNAWAIYAAGGKSYFGGEIEQIDSYVNTPATYQTFNSNTLTLTTSALDDTTVNRVDLSQYNYIFDIDHSSTKLTVRAQDISVSTTGSTATLNSLNGQYLTVDDDSGNAIIINGQIVYTKIGTGNTVNTNATAIGAIASVQSDCPSLVGVSSIPWASNTVAIGDMFAFKSTPRIAAGSTNTLTLTNSYGFYTECLNFLDDTTGTNTITNSYGFYYKTSAFTQTVTNEYGLYIESPTQGTNKWAIYVAGGEIEQVFNVTLDENNNEYFNIRTATLTTDAVNTSGYNYYNAFQYNLIADIDNTYTSATLNTIHITADTAGSTAALDGLGALTIDVSDTGVNVDDLRGINCSVVGTTGYTGTRNSIFGLDVRAYPQGDTTTVKGILGDAWTLLGYDLTVTDFIGVEGRTDIRISTGFTSNITNAVAVKSVVLNAEATGTNNITNLYGFYHEAPVGTTQSVTNEYGIYVEAPNLGTNQWAMYVAGGESYFGGEITQTTSLSIVGDTATDFNNKVITFTTSATTDVSYSITTGERTEVIFDVDHSSTKALLYGTEVYTHTTGSTAALYYLGGGLIAADDTANVADYIDGLVVATTAGNGYTGTRSTVTGVANNLTVSDDATLSMAQQTTLKINSASFTATTGVIHRARVTVNATSTNTINMTDLIGYEAYMLFQEGTGTANNITNMYGFYYRQDTATTHTVTNEYGLYIENPSLGATAYAIYVAGGTSYFGGDVTLADDGQLQWGDGSTDIRANSSTDTIRIFTASTQAIRIDSTGQLLVGSATSINNALDVYHTSTDADLTNTDTLFSETGAAARFYNDSDSGNWTGILLRTRTTGAAVWSIANEWTASYQGDLVFRGRDGSSSSAEVMRIRHDQTIGINGAPASNATITISGKASDGNSRIRLDRTASTDICDIFFNPSGTLSASNVQWNIGLQASSDSFKMTYYDGTSTYTPFAFTNAGVIELDKTTADNPFFNFKATADADTTSAISTLTTSGATTHHIQVDINGTKGWIAVSTNAPS